MLREEHAGGAAVEGFGLVAQEHGWLFVVHAPLNGIQTRVLSILFDANWRTIDIGSMGSV